MSEIMMQNLHAGLMMAILGMGVVMAFLVLMMGVMRVTEIIMAKLNKWFPEEVPVIQTTKKQTSANNEEIALAIAAAMRKISVKGGN